jgi:WD40 repeat protein
LAIGGAGTAMAPDPKGGLLGVGGELVELWDLARQEYFAKLEGHARRVTTLSWPRESRTLVSGDSDGSIRVWNVDNWECVGVIQTPEGCLYDMAVTDDGSRIVSAASKSNGEDIDIARVWDASTNKEITALKGQNQELSKLRGCIAVTDDSRMLLADGNTLRLCDMATGKTIAELGERWGPRVAYVDLSPNGRWLATWSWDRLRTVQKADEAGSRPAVQFDQTVRLWDLSTRKCVALVETTGFDVPQHQPIVSRDGSLIGVCSDTQSVAIWESYTQTRLAHLPMSTARLKTMTFSDDAHFLATGDYDNLICVWDASTGAQIASLTGHSGPVTCLAFSRDGQQLLSGSYDKSVRLWDWKNAQCLKSFRGHSEEITSVAMTADGRQLISSSQDKTIRIWNSSTGKCDQILDGPANWHCTQLLLTADDKLLVARHEYEIWLWDLATSAPLLSIPALSRGVGVDEVGHVLTTVYDFIVQRWSVQS